jgi:hypothetical protein
MAIGIGARVGRRYCEREFTVPFREGAVVRRGNLGWGVRAGQTGGTGVVSEGWLDALEAAVGL